MASPISTGGGGSNFERHVGAYYLAQLLLRSVPFGLAAGSTREVRFQRLFADEPLDDLVIVADSVDGDAKLSLQIKRDLAFGASDHLFDDTLRRCWETFSSPHFSRSKHIVGLVLGTYSKEVDKHYVRVLEWARKSATAVDFWERIAHRELASQSMQKFAERVRTKLRSYSTTDLGDDEVWHFLRSMVILRLDLHGDLATSSAYASIVEAIRRVLPPGREDDAPKVFTYLLSYAAEANQTAGSFNQAILVEHLVADGIQVYLPPTNLGETGTPFDVAQLAQGKPFIGRTHELFWLEERLQHTDAKGLAALRGVGGIGKSALAAEAIYRLTNEGCFPDGVAVIRCTERRDPSDVLHKVLERFFPQRQSHGPDAFVDLASAARRLFAGKQVLVVLDDIEPELGRQITPLVLSLRDAGATLLLTSRQRLPVDAVPAQADRHLEALPLQEALYLFAQSYGLGGAHDLAAADRTSVERIVQALGRHTLAVKLVGAYAIGVHRSLNQLAIELEQDPLNIVDDETPRAIELVFARCLHHLPRAAQRLFTALGVFASPRFTRTAAIDVARAVSQDELASGHATGAEALVDLLIKHALLEPETIVVHGPVTSQETLARASNEKDERLYMHVLVHRYAQELFAHAGESDRRMTELAVAAHYATTVLLTDNESRILDEPNILAALEWAHQAGADVFVAALCNGMQYLWRHQWQTDKTKKYMPWGVEASERLAHQSGRREERLGAAAIALAYGIALYRTGQLAEADDIFQRNLIVRRECEDRRGEGVVLSWLGGVAHLQGDLGLAQQRYEEAAAIYHEISDHQEASRVLGKLAQLEMQRGQMEAAQHHFERLLSDVRKLQDRQMERDVLGNLGYLARAMGRMDEAQHYLSLALQLSREAGDRHGEAEALFGLGQIAHARGNLAQATDHFDEALRRAIDMQDQQMETALLSNLGEVAQQHGRMDAAEHYYERALKLATAGQNRREVGAILGCLGHLAYLPTGTHGKGKEPLPTGTQYS